MSLLYSSIYPEIVIFNCLIFLYFGYLLLASVTNWSHAGIESESVESVVNCGNDCTVI